MDPMEKSEEEPALLSLTLPSDAVMETEEISTPRTAGKRKECLSATDGSERHTPSPRTSGRATPTGDASASWSPQRGGECSLVLGDSLGKGVSEESQAESFGNMPKGPQIDRALWSGNRTENTQRWTTLSLLRKVKDDVRGLRSRPMEVETS